MKINEIIGNVFDTEDDNYFVHCISQDYKMRMGISADFNKKFELKHKLSRINSKFPNCILIDRVFNLIIKEKYWHKPSYSDLHVSFMIMKKICIEKQIKKVAIPKVIFESNNLSWIHVKKILLNVFKDVDVEINIYSNEFCEV